MKIASSPLKSSPASANAEGEPRPQSMTKTRPSTTSAEEIPARPATGSGAPAVPRSTSSVVIVASAFVLWRMRAQPTGKRLRCASSQQSANNLAI